MKINLYMKNKKGIAPIFIVGIIILILIAFYILLYLPIPAFASIRNIINYFIVIIMWIILQVGIVLGYYYAIKYLIKGVQIYKSKIQKKILDVKYLMIMRT